MESIPTRLPEPEFLESFKYGPKTAVNYFITNQKGDILLAQRNIEPNNGSWHLPGTFVLNNEPISTALKRLAKTELGAELDTKALKLIGAFDDLKSDPRGHVIDLVFGIQLHDTLDIAPTNETKNVKFFNKNSLPEKIGFNHRETISALI